MPRATCLSSVLVLEHDAVLAALLEDVLKDWGIAKVRAFGSAAAALAAAQVEAFDCALIDISRGMSACSPLVDLLMEHGVPMAFSAGLGEEGSEPLLHDAPVLVKPFNDCQLHACLLSVAA